jgi:hypothetical protein
VEMIYKVWQHLEVDCRFKPEANALEAGLKVHPCSQHRFTLRTSVNVILHWNTTSKWISDCYSRLYGEKAYYSPSKHE